MPKAATKHPMDDTMKAERPEGTTTTPEGSSGRRARVSSEEHDEEARRGDAPHGGELSKHGREGENDHPVGVSDDDANARAPTPKRARLDSDGSDKTTEAFAENGGREADADKAAAEKHRQPLSAAQERMKQTMSLKELQNKYKDVFGMSTKVHNKDWILYKIGERTPPESTDEEVPASLGNDSPQKPVANATAAPPATGPSGKVGKGSGKDDSSRRGGRVVDIPEGRNRCSRNDGKNWRCSEIAMPGHKHCEKHMRWSAGGRAKQQNAAVKRPRWLAQSSETMNAAVRGGTGVTLPPGFDASSAAAGNPLLSAAASALTELKHEEATMRGAGGTAFPPGFGTFWSGGGPYANSNPGVNMFRPMAMKAPFCVDSLTGGASSVETNIVDCSVEIVPSMAGSAAGTTARRGIDFVKLDSFDALHRELAGLVGISVPPGGRYDPSSLQLAYTDAAGTPAVVMGETWATFKSRARAVHARLLAPDSGPAVSAYAPQAGFPSQMMYNPFLAMMGLQPPLTTPAQQPPAPAPSGLAGLQWAQQAGMMGGIDQGTMAMMMMMASAGGPEASNAFLAAAAKHAQSQSNAAAETTPPAAKPTADGARNENEGGTTNG